MPVTYLLLLGYKCNIFVCSLKTVLVPLDTFLLPAAMMLSFLNRECARKTLEEEKDFLHPNSVCGSQGHSAWGDGRCVGWGAWEGVDGSAVVNNAQLTRATWDLEAPAPHG